MIFSATVMLLASCSNKQAVLEVTTFQLKSTADSTTFNQLDAEVEGNFTSKQSGYIKRQSAVSEDGEYVVLVYWNSIKDADTSMQKFMKDGSVAEYAAMIDENSMKMARYTIDKKFDANSSTFVEVMSFNTKKDTDLAAFNTTNQKVETSFTAQQAGFLQRITGVDESGQQVVAIYWDNKSNSDTALTPFMKNPISKEFMGMMEQNSIHFGRYQTLSSLTH